MLIVLHYQEFDGPSTIVEVLDISNPQVLARLKNKASEMSGGLRKHVEKLIKQNQAARVSFEACAVVSSYSDNE